MPSLVRGRWVQGRAVVVDDVGGRFRSHVVALEPDEPGVAVVVPLPGSAGSGGGSGRRRAVSRCGSATARRRRLPRGFFLTAGDTVAGKASESQVRHREY